MVLHNICTHLVEIFLVDKFFHNFYVIYTLYLLELEDFVGNCIIWALDRLYILDQTSDGYPEE